jgi:hypothetical protein
LQQAYANCVQRSITENTQLKLLAMNSGESVTKWLQGVEALL